MLHSMSKLIASKQVVNHLAQLCLTSRCNAMTIQQAQHGSAAVAVDSSYLKSPVKRLLLSTGRVAFALPGQSGSQWRQVMHDLVRHVHINMLDWQSTP